MSYHMDFKNKSEDEKITMLLRGCGHFLFLQSNWGSSQLSVLQLLKADGPMSQKDLAKRLGVKPASVSELVTKLERKKFLERRRSEVDRRKVVLDLTEKGRSIHEMKVEEKGHYYDVLTSEEKVLLISSLNKLLCSWIEEDEQ